MSTLDNKIVNKRSKDELDKFIFEKGLRITEVIAKKNQDSLIVFLNKGQALNIRLSSFARLKKASQKQLDGWKLISKGVGIEWSEIDEDLSLKGLIQQFVKENTLRFVAGDASYAMAA
ncbi:MAG TPA: DUF2442 domain-containing protein [Chitinophagales bacterium]|nr:DUF2442 domain-containing protein [Chitinophagales bacterium]